MPTERAARSSPWLTIWEKVAPAVGLEPTTRGLTVRCSESRPPSPRRRVVVYTMPHPGFGRIHAHVGRPGATALEPRSRAIEPVARGGALVAVARRRHRDLGHEHVRLRDPSEVAGE